MDWLKLLEDILPFIAAGFVAQIIDGALGMAFGVISTTLLITLGTPPAAASASVHIVETFTTGLSGISHILRKNIDWSLFRRLALPGIAGGIIGAYFLTQVDASVIKPFILAYLAIIGVMLVYRGWRYPPRHKPAKVVGPLGLVGGFLDAAGGGGWGPIVTGNLLAQGAEPRRVIGTVNTTEFLLTLAVSITFLSALGWESFSKAMVGLLIGGLLAAPLGAIIAERANPKALLVAVGTILVATSLFGIWRAFA